MDVIIIKDSISRTELKKMASEQYGTLVKAVVDVEKGIMALGGELHADEETALIEKENSNREKDRKFLALYKIQLKEMLKDEGE